MKKWIGCIALASILLGCVTTTQQTRGIQFIEQLDQNEFNLFVAEMKLIISVGSSELVNHKVVKVEDLHALANTIESIANNPVSDSAKLVLRKLVSDKAIIDLLKIAELEIRRHGGFSVVKQSDGTFALSDRSKAILLGIVDGLRTV